VFLWRGTWTLCGRAASIFLGCLIATQKKRRYYVSLYLTFFTQQTLASHDEYTSEDPCPSLPLGSNYDKTRWGRR